MLSKLLSVIADTMSYERLVPLAVACIAVFLLMSSLRRRRAGSAASQPAPLPPLPASIGPLRRDLDELLVELQELSRRITAEIDTRFAKLEAAIRDADRRIAVLHRLARNESDPAGTDPARTAASDPDGAAAAEPDRATPPAPAGHDPRHAVIYELADAGFTPIEIARDLGKTPGEVELILNLRRQVRA